MWKWVSKKSNLLLVFILIWLIPQVSRAPTLDKASLRRRSPPSCTFVLQPQTECGRHDRLAVAPGSASETHGQKVLPWPTDTGRDGGEGQPQPGKIRGGWIRGSWIDGGVGDLGDWCQGPRVRGRFFIGEVKQSWAMGALDHLKTRLNLLLLAKAPLTHTGPFRGETELSSATCSWDFYIYYSEKSALFT